MSNKLQFVGGLFLGTIIGGALGVLLAPNSGEETRKKLKENTEEALGNAYDQAIEYGENLKEQLQDMQEQITDRVNQYKNQIESKIQEIQDEVNQDIAGLNKELEELQKEQEDQEEKEVTENETLPEEVSKANVLEDDADEKTE